MSDYHDRGFRLRIPPWMFVLAIVGGGAFFFRHFGIAGLDHVSIYPKSQVTGEAPFYDDGFVSHQTHDASYQAAVFPTPKPFTGPKDENPFELARQVVANVAQPQADHSLGGPPVNLAPVNLAPGNLAPVSVAPVFTPAEMTRPRVRNLRIASWALDGFTPSKLANPIARKNIIRVIRQFDIVAFQQVASLERDLIPRLIDAANEGGRHYDYLVGDQTGPNHHSEQLAFIFDVRRVQIDRTQTYTVADPDRQMTYDPLVAWFRALGVPAQEAWTFSLVNVRIDLGRAPQEVALLSNIMAAVKSDGRGEDDVVMAGLFQADDEYLVPLIAGEDTRAAVRSVPTDIFGRHQVSNVLMDSKVTSEYIGRGGAFDFLRTYNLSAAESETITSHLPVFAEFTATEGGKIH